MKKMKYFSKKTPFIITEIASAHDGSVKKLQKLFNLAVKTGSDAIKFQIFKTENFISIKNPMFSEFKKIEISYDNWKEIFSKNKKYKHKIIIEPYDIESLNFCLSLNIFSAIKVPTTCIDDIAYINALKKIKKPTIIGVGGLKINEIKKIYIDLNKDKRELVLMHGIQNFPTNISHLNLNKINFLKKNFKSLVGYADHTNSNDFFYSNYVSLLAYSMGAQVIEKHLTINRHLKGRDYYSALNPDEFKNFIDMFKVNLKIMGEEKWIINKADKKYSAFSKKYAVANKKIKKNKKINILDISFKRTNIIGLDYLSIKKILNKKIKKNLNFDEVLKISDFK